MIFQTLVQLLLLAITMMLCLIRAHAGDEGNNQANFAATVGAASASDLEIVVPTAVENPNFAGFSIDLATYNRGGHWQDRDVVDGIKTEAMTIIRDMPELINHFAGSALPPGTSIGLRREGAGPAYSGGQGGGWYPGRYR